MKVLNFIRGLDSFNNTVKPTREDKCLRRTFFLKRNRKGIGLFLKTKTIFTVNWIRCFKHILKLVYLCFHEFVNTAIMNGKITCKISIIGRFLKKLHI